MKHLYIFIYVFSCLTITSSLTFAFDDKRTHKKLSAEAIENSQLSNYLPDQLFIRNIDARLEYGAKGYKITQWSQEGSYEEDQPSCRAANHFHNPLKPWDQGMLTDSKWIVDRYCDLTSSFRDKYSNLVWATGYINKAKKLDPPVNDNSEINEGRNWKVARTFFYDALTSEDPVQHEGKLAQTFFTLGYVMHLLQDVAVPAHTRNDFSQGHAQVIGCPADGCDKPWSWKGNPFEAYVRDNWSVIIAELNRLNININKPFIGEKTLTNFWDTTDTNNEGATPSNFDGQDLGLAEYSNLNFVSHSTIFKESNDTEHYFKYPSRESIIDKVYPDNINQQIYYDLLAQDGELDTGIYITKEEGEGHRIEKFLSMRYALYGADYDEPTKFYLKFKLDNNCFKEYATHLIPRAVGYSAGLIDYFFRGTLEISPPTEYVYSVIDGSGFSEFTTLKAKVRNTSVLTDASGATVAEEIGDGLLRAVARYREIPNYMADLSDYPDSGPEMDSRMQGVGFSYAVSESLEINATNPIPSDTSAEFIFSFTNKPIPAGITDLSFQVVFQGTLGDEQDSAVAVGFKDLNEPQHITFWNDTDYFLLNNTPVKAEDIQNDPLVEFYGYIWPFSYKQTIKISRNYPITDPPLLIEVNPQSPARYSRFVLITDSADAEYYFTDHIEAMGPPDAGGIPTTIVDGTWIYSLLTATAQLDDVIGDWNLSPITTVRGVIQHQRVYYMNAYPDFTFTNILPAPSENALGPQPATIKFPLPLQ